MVLTSEEFRSCIRWTSTECLQLGTVTEFITEAKVCKLYVEVGIKQQILSLKMYSML